ncbi:hypothetical protein J7K91_00710 [bacterium]|nr:hypothetical protein [bacterium]
MKGVERMKKEEVKKMYQDQFENLLRILEEGTRKMKEGYKDVISAFRAIPLFLEDEREEEKKMIKERIEDHIRTCKELKERFVSLLFSAYFFLEMFAEARNVKFPERTELMELLRESLEI